jgi:hypothetical protein
MDKTIFKVLTISAIMLFPVLSVSCGDDTGNLETRVTVLEGMIRSLEEDLQKAMVTGATITSSFQDANGVWTLGLSDGKTITINPSSGGGADVSVEQTDSEVIIKVGDKEYVLPLGGGNYTMVYCPEFTDGNVVMDIKGSAIAAFLVTPGLTAGELESAKLSIADARELSTRSDAGMFEVNSASIEDGRVLVNIGLTDDKASGKTFTVAVKMSVKNCELSSNYFTLVVPEGISLNEDLSGCKFIDAVNPQQQADGSWNITLSDEFDFLGEFDLNNLFAEKPSGTAKFGLANTQTGNAEGKIEWIQSCLNGNTWKCTSRPGTAFPEGILFTLKVDNSTRCKFRIIVNDPLADVDWKKGSLAPTGQHFEYGPVVPVGGGFSFDFQKMFGDYENFDADVKGEKYFGHGDAKKFCEAWCGYSVTLNGEDVVYVEDGYLKAGDAGKKYCKFSKGVYWIAGQTSIAASQRQNWSMTDDEKKAFAGSDCSGEIIGGWDGISGSDMADYGLSVSADGKIVLTDKYQGHACRVAMGPKFQYDYGEVEIGNYWTAFIWFNRRLCPEGVKDPAAR